MSEPAPPDHRLMPLLRQFLRFFGTGLVAALVHYAVLIVLVEFYQAEAVRAAVSGYVAGGITSYLLNRHFTYETERSHVVAATRFALVAGIGFLITWGLMALFTRSFGWHYLPAQIITTGVVLFWSFFAHKHFSFGDST